MSAAYIPNDCPLLRMIGEKNIVELETLGENMFRLEFDPHPANSVQNHVTASSSSSLECRPLDWTE
jgi:hypothetical protein